jgi:2-hydroxychromene-2-carboxylate isomerase
MTLTYDLFWSFRSPYSYLVTPRLLEFEREYDVTTNVRPVYPIAVRIDSFFKTVNPLWRSYLLRDVAPALTEARQRNWRSGIHVM